MLLAKLAQVKKSDNFQLSGASFLAACTLHPFKLNFGHTSKQNWAIGCFESQVNALRDEDRGGNHIDFWLIGNRKVIQTSIFNQIKVSLPSFLQILQKHFSVKGSRKSFLQKSGTYYLDDKDSFLSGKNTYIYIYFFLYTEM